MLHRDARPVTVRQSTTTIAYIDGFNLYHGLRSKFGRRYLWLNLHELVRQLRPADDILTVRYFTALVRDDPPALHRQQTYLAALRAHCGDRLEIVEGRFQRKSCHCRVCGASWTQYEEKETDVNIAVSLVADAAAVASELALIISADSDLCPAIRTARALAPSRRMIVAFPPARRSFEIGSLVPGNLVLGADKIRRSLLPNHVAECGKGITHSRPDHWK